MKVVCDNCRAVYKIPDEKLVKPVNKATCRNCGHRMLIPRPRKDADPEERTLVTAVPPTPSPAPGRMSAPVEDDKTLPGRIGASSGGEVAERYGTPVQVRERGFDPGGIAPGGAPHSPTTLPESPRTQPPVSSMDSAPTIAAPTQVLNISDPAGDMVIALVGAVGSITGAFMLGLVPATTPGIGAFALVVVGLGLLLSISGGFLAVLVILTGSRGRRRASRFMSLATSTVLGVLVSALVAGALPFALSTFSRSQTMAAGTPELPMPDRDLAPEVPKVAEVQAPPVQEEPAKPSTPSAPPSHSSGPAAYPPVAPAYTPPVEPSRPVTPSRQEVVVRVPPTNPKYPPATAPAAAAPAPARTAPPQDEFAFLDEPDLPEESFDVGARGHAAAAPAAPAAVESPSMETIDIILRNNVDIKRCFFAHMKAAGSLPSNVKVRFTVEPGGSVSTAGITDREFQGTELDRCLSRTIRGLSFPPFNGPPSKVTYPFVL